MRAFAELFQALDATTGQSAKLAALVAYLRVAPPSDAAWATYFLAGGKPRQMVPTKRLKALAQEAAGLPEWLFEESYQAVGDLAETLALLLPPPVQPLDLPLAEWMAQLLPLRALPPDEADARLRAQWDRLAPEQRFVYFKLITGNFRVGVSRLQVTQALATVSALDPKRIAHRLMGYTQIGRQPQADDYSALVAPVGEAADGDAGDAVDAGMAGQPYPFFLAHPFNQPVAEMPALLGTPGDWLVEWKWDGIRAQIVRRGGAVWVWSRGEELVTDRFPELAGAAMAQLPDGSVVDGEILVWLPGEPQPRPFADLQKRLGRKTLGPKLLRELPVVLVTYDLLEHAGQDLRQQPQQARRALLEALLQPSADAPQGTLPTTAEPITPSPSKRGAGLRQAQSARLVELDLEPTPSPSTTTARQPTLRLSALLHGANWDDLARQREAARGMGTEGFMLKNRQAHYGVGRTKDVGVWWKWKIDPMSVDAVLIYAQRGHGRRASLYSDYTFAVWNGPPDDPERQLVPFAKAYSGLTDVEIGQVDAIVRKTTRESFGPVRSVDATMVFELGFEGIGKSPRHKSGIAVRFPRMLRWRKDKTVAEADTLQTLMALLPGQDAPG
ncbi:ATP-dependent DNA ligase [Acidovorax sp. Leaf78]|uniref:ATP-dependent DNA ligase n=1 Tax=unclassified Acidovorax TaxID=2684926 RepID=UPI0006FB507B|nr:ATP-dependent DNA ligase [Acidovorax sp. Leaf78]KQO23103.1 ATP-dependent DNA ligase [Acidovorax sp. Leaf78]